MDQQAEARGRRRWMKAGAVVGGLGGLFLLGVGISEGQPVAGLLSLLACIAGGASFGVLVRADGEVPFGDVMREPFAVRARWIGAHLLPGVVLLALAVGLLVLSSKIGT